MGHTYLDGSPCFPEEHRNTASLQVGNLGLLSGFLPYNRQGKEDISRVFLKSCNCLENLVILTSLKPSQPLIVGLDREQIPNGFLPGVGGSAVLLGWCCTMGMCQWVEVNLLLWPL